MRDIYQNHGANSSNQYTMNKTTFVDNDAGNTITDCNFQHQENKYIPGTPGGPCGPVDPWIPCCPGGPIGPTTPGGPANPSLPSFPGIPFNTYVICFAKFNWNANIHFILPMSPFVPGGPAAPGVPSFPSLPSLPSTPSSPLNNNQVHYSLKNIYIYLFLPGGPGGPARLSNHGRGPCFLILSTPCGVLD